MNLENRVKDKTFDVSFLLEFASYDFSKSKHVKNLNFAINFFRSFYGYFIKGKFNSHNDIDNLPDVSLEQLKNLYSFNHAMYMHYDSFIVPFSVKHNLGHLHSHKATIARIIVDKVKTDEEKLVWLNKSLQAYVKCLECCEKIDNPRFVNQLSFKGEVELYIAFLVDKGKNYGCVKSAYFTNLQYITEIEKSGIKGKEETVRVNSLNCVDLALRLATLSFEEKKGKDMVVSWLDKGKEELKKHLSDPRAGYNLTLYADESEKFGDGFSNLETKVLFFERAYEENLNGSKIIKDLNYSHHIVSLLNAGRVAEKLYRLTLLEKHRQDAISCYSSFIKKFNAKPVADLEALYKAANSIVRVLKNDVLRDEGYAGKRHKGKKLNKKDSYRTSKLLKKRRGHRF